MATGTFDLGDYTLEDDSNGDLVIKDTNNNIVMRWDTGNGQWNLESQTLTNIGTVNTDRLYNDEEPSLDISRLAHALGGTAGVLVPGPIESLDGWGQTTSGSGSVSITNSLARLETGTTSGSSARIQDNISFGDWDTPVTLRILGTFSNSGTGYMVQGLVSDSDKTGEHVGIAQVNGDLVATVADGSTENTTTLVSGISNNSGHEYTIVIDPSTPEVRYYKGGGVTASADATLTSNVPTGSGNFVFRTALAENSTSNNRVFDLKHHRVGVGI